MLEHVLPIGNVLPEARELIEVNRPSPVGIEGSHQHLDRIQIEVSPIPVHKRSLELIHTNVARLISVDRLEPRPELGIVAWGSASSVRVRVRPAAAIARPTVGALMMSLMLTLMLRVVGRVACSLLRASAVPGVLSVVRHGCCWCALRDAVAAG